MTRWMTPCIVACLLIGASRSAIAAPAPAHRESAAATRACLACHESAKAVLSGPMAMRSNERSFAHRAFGVAEGDRFFDSSCSGCHVTTCGDCHGSDAHPMGRPGNAACLRCHRGYSVGWEYEGKAPREDHARYQRGATSEGEPFLKMLPDVHFERGLPCADCHPMASLHVGGRAKTCRDCHTALRDSSPEHSIATHLETMECAACHAAWSSQEYATFLVNASTNEAAEAFAPLRRWGNWQKSAHLKRQDSPPLGLDRAGRVVPIRPRFVLLVTDRARGWENRLVAAEWRAYVPHTIRGGTTTCGGCHDNPRRFLLEKDADRIYRIDRDGIPLRSYWNRDGQTVVNGSFMPRERHERMNAKTPEYQREAVRQWKNLIDHADPR